MIRCVEAVSIDDAVLAIRQVEKTGGDYGALHIVVADGNLDDDDIANGWKQARILDGRDNPAERAANFLCLSALSQLSVDDRYDAWDKAAGVTE